MSPFFSVIIPTYNRAHLIVKTIRSVLNQSFRDFEIIVVDNHSTDNTVEELEPFLKERSITLVLQDKNYERAVSRNKGFDHATGKYVTLLDSDDIMYSSCLQDAYEFLQLNPQATFFHSAHQTIDEDGIVLSIGNLHPPLNPFKKLATGNYISNIGIFIETSVARTVRVDETPVLIGMEDYDFLLRVLNKTGSVGFIPKINSGILNHPSRTVLTQEMERIKNRVDFFIAKSLKSELFSGFFSPFKKYFLSGNHLYICGAAAIRGMTKTAFIYLIKAVKSHPAIIFSLRFWKHCFVIFKYIGK